MPESPETEVRFVGAEISEEALVGVLIGSAGDVLTRITTQITADAPLLSQLLDFVIDLKSKLGPFETLGLAIPGLIDRNTKRVVLSTRLQELSDIDLKHEFRNAAGLNPFIENDANAAAYAEFKVGAGRGSGNMFYATLGTGVGGALILNGELWRGVSGFAGEFGFVAIDDEGQRLEDVGSASNIVRRFRERFHQDSTSVLSKLSEDEITLKDIVNAAEQGDDLARLMLERTGAYVGSAIATVINLLNVEKIVIGGEVMTAGPFVLEAIIQRAQELSFAPSFEGTEIIGSELTENSAAIGAAMLANGI